MPAVDGHDPVVEANPGWRSIGDDSFARRKRPRQSLLVDVHHQRIARSPGAARSGKAAVEHRMHAAVVVKSLWRELNDSTYVYGIDIGCWTIILVVVRLLDVL